MRMEAGYSPQFLCEITHSQALFAFPFFCCWRKTVFEQVADENQKVLLAQQIFTLLLNFPTLQSLKSNGREVKQYRQNHFFEQCYVF